MAARRGRGVPGPRRGRDLLLRAVALITDTSRVTRNGRIAAIASCALACCLGLSLWLVVRDSGGSPSRAVSSVLIQRQPWGPEGTPGGQPRVLTVATPLAACETRLEREPLPLPTIAIVGASYTAGVGPGSPELSWAVTLARLLHWNAVIDGVPGAGYVMPGAGGHGPMTRMLSTEELRALDPSVVIVQAGHDDVGVPPAPERARVRATLGLIQLAAPGAQVALLTVFSGALDGTPALRLTDHVIVTAAEAADPQVIIMDPLTGQWEFQHAGGGLHPTAAGDAWIARTVLAILSAHGVSPAPANGTVPVICDVSVGVHQGTSASA
jgi:acyl-CoA thioesterase I